MGSINSKQRKNKKVHKASTFNADQAKRTGTNNTASPPIYTKEPSMNQDNLVCALYDYFPNYDGAIQLRKGDMMELISIQEEWYEVRKQEANGKNITGYVPVTYVRRIGSDPEQSQSWFNITRQDAERMLLWPGLKVGTYITRPSTDPGMFALSVLNRDINTNAPKVTHYKILTTESPKSYTINNIIKFTSFLNLIEHYSKNDGLSCRLNSPCPRPEAYVPPPNFSEFEWNRDIISLEHQLGNGAFGDVWQAKLNRTFDVAVKRLKSEFTTDAEMHERFIKEAKVMHKLNHPKLVRLLGVCTVGAPILIIQELMPNGALNDYLKKKGPRELPFPTLINMLSQIAQGMSYLEAHKAIHRDLRACNVLVGEKNEVKVSDFGLSKLEEQYIGNEKSKYPIRWAAPEVFDQTLFTIKGDVWSFGIVIYEVLTYGGKPYPNIPTELVPNQVRLGARMQNPQDTPIAESVTNSHGCFVQCPTTLYEEMLKCWKEVPEERPTFEALSKFFDSAMTPNYDAA